MSVEQVTSQVDTHAELKEALLKWDIENALWNQKENSEKISVTLESEINWAYEFVEKMEDPSSSFPHSPDYDMELSSLLDNFLNKTA